MRDTTGPARVHHEKKHPPDGDGSALAKPRSMKTYETIVESIIGSFVLSLVVFSLNGCNWYESQQAVQSTPSDGGALLAVAELRPRSGSNAKGSVTFEEKANALQINATVEDVSPGRHGIHIHETGDCSAPDASSAGGHFNPTSRSHGAPLHAEHHVGDLGNIEVGENGTGTLNITLPSEGFSAWRDLLGRSVVVHSKTDDFVSQPAGDSGARIACGVIEAPPAMNSPPAVGE